MIEQGREVGGGDTRSDIGCQLEIADFQRFGDGTWALTAIASALPVGGLDRQRLLIAPSTRERFDLLHDMVREQHALIDLMSRHGDDSNG